MIIVLDRGQPVNQRDGATRLTAACCSWLLCSPPALPADTPAKRFADRILPRTGLPVVAYFAAVAVAFAVPWPVPIRAELAIEAFAALAAGAWCSINFWRCRHAHCVVTGAGWLGLSGWTFVEVGLGRSLIAGHEGLVFLGVVAAGALFETAWHLTRGTRVVAPMTPRAHHPAADASGGR